MARLAQGPTHTGGTLLNIRTREELTNALQEAVQVEHGLMLQYLFAAVSCKKFSPREHLTERQAERVRDWERRILQIARDEMGHLATVCNLLNAVGGSPNFNRPNFPQPARQWLPFVYSLQRLSVPTLERFVRFESPPPSQEATIQGIAPAPIVYDYVGELYRSIAQGFRTVDAEAGQLFIGRDEAQEDSDWTARLWIPAIRDVPGAQAAIEFIVRQGEGTPKGEAESHFGEFTAIRSELRREQQIDERFDPARLVVDNPLTRKERGVGPGYTLLVAGSMAAEVAELFNHLYASTLLMLTQLFDPAGETQEQRALLRASCRRMMSAIVRPLAEVLTELPSTNSGAEMAGPPFEIYADLRLPAHPPARWAVLVERLLRAEKETARLAASGGAQVSRLAFLARNLGLLREALEGATGRRNG